MQNYRDFVDAVAQAVKQAGDLPLGASAPCSNPQIAEDAPEVMLMSPHPDDECIIGTLPLRLLRQNRMKVTNVAVTQGSRKDRQTARFQELQEACNCIGLQLIQTQKGGLENIKLDTRQNTPKKWWESVNVILKILQSTLPAIVFMPHADDWNSTHIGTHYLVMDALKIMPPDFSCIVVETEYWQPMTDPNLMVECDSAMLAELINALTFHRGEVARNPYHLALPAWMQDNVRRGSELAGGQGESAPNFLFATLYRISHWQNGVLTKTDPAQRLLDCRSVFQTG